ncbi:MAG: Fur family transcriptional regulator [Acidobacteriota bacterium]|jgi:Fur family peroxide stress response transcriptional regulator|nr:Fur family transcriptional regulator [Acidobacteriota bacterium]
MKKETPRGRADLPDMAAFTELCHSHGLKVTPQRNEIFRQLLISRDHPCADALYRRVKRKFPGISFDTVHRTLQTFTDLGLAHVVEGTGVPRRFDPNLDDHYHFWCRICRRVFDLPVRDQDKRGVALELPDYQGYRVLKARLVLEGVCAECLQKTHDDMDGGRSL